MSTVSSNRSSRYSNASQWPSWTDQVRAEVPATDWPDWCDARTFELPPAVAGEPTPADWLAAEVSRQRGMSRMPSDYHDLVATVLNDLAITFRLARARTVRELPAWDQLAAIQVPESRISEAADILDELASEYWAMDSDLARVAAGAIIAQADQVEFFRAGSLEEFFDREAAWLEASSDVAGEIGDAFLGHDSAD